MTPEISAALAEFIQWWPALIILALIFCSRRRD